jgi:hypothetical protein
VAKPTVDPCGPIGCTSMKRIAMVHSANAASNPSAMQKFLFFILYDLPFFVFGFRHLQTKAWRIKTQEADCHIHDTLRIIAF